MDNSGVDQGLTVIAAGKNPLKRFLKENFDWPFSRLETISACLFQIFGIVHCVVFQSYLDNDIVEDDSKRYPVFYTLSVLSPIIGFYGMITWKLNQGLIVNLIIFTFFIVAPIIIILVLIGQNLILEYLELTVACIFVTGSVIGINLFKLIRKQVITEVGKNLGEVLIILLNALCNLLSNMVVSVLLLNEDALSDPGIIISYSAIIWLVMLVVVWTMIHTTLFKRYPNEIQSMRTEILSTREHSMKIQVILNENPEILNLPNEGFLLKYGHLLASTGILVPFLCVQIGLISVLSEFTSGKYPDSALYLSLFYILASPVFLYLGMIFSSSKLIARDKYLSVILILSLIPTIFIMWLSYSLYSSTTTYYLGLVIGIGFPGSLVYWLSMSMIYQYNKRSYQYFSSIFCLSFIIPIGLILPLYYAEGMSSLTFWITEGILLFSGILLLIIWLIQLLFKMTRELCSLIRELSTFHSEDLSLYIYTFSFLLGYSLVAWMMFKRIDYKNDWTSGLLAGCFVVLALTVVNSLFVHRLSLYHKEADRNEEDLDEIIQGSAKEVTLVQSRNRRVKKQSQVLLVVVGLAVTLAVSIPVLVTSTGENNESAGITVIVGGLMSVFIFLTIIELKHYLKKFGEAVISFMLGYCWIFCFIPLIVLIPVTLSSTTSETDQRSVTSWSIGTILLLFMIGVSIFSITLNLLFHRMEYEKIAKFCCLQVQEMLSEKGVKASLVNLRGIYDNFYNSSPESVTKVLEAKTVYSYQELDEKDPDLSYSKELLTLRELNKLKSGMPEVAAQDVKRGLTFSEYCKKICKKKQKESSVILNSNLAPEELGEIRSEAAADALESKNSQDVMMEPAISSWAGKFQEDIAKEQEMQMALARTVKFKADFGVNPVEKVSLDTLPAVKLNKKRRTVLMKSRELELILSNYEARKYWMMAVFARFSSGMIGNDGEAWMNLSDLRNFIRLCGLEKAVNNVTCDILYVSITRRYNSENASITNVKINFDEFCNRLIPELRRLVKNKFPSIETENDLIKEQLFPHLVTNLPYLKLIVQELDPDEEVVEDIIENNEEHVANIFHERRNSVERIENGQRKSIRILNPNTLKRLQTFNLEENKVMCSKCLDKFSNCSSSFFKILITCCGRLFDFSLNTLKSNSTNKVTKYEQHKEKPKLLERQPSPSWEEICSLIVEKFEESNKEARKGENEKTIYMTLNLANLIGVFGHITEIYSFSSIGFYKEVGWTYGSSFTRTSTVILADNDYWVETYWTCFSCSIIFVFLLIPALKLIKLGRLGLNPDFTVAKFPSVNFLLSKFIGLFGKTMYMTVMCSFLSSFSCVYSNNSWHLMRYSSIECFSSEHTVYFVLSIAAIIIYYPAATLIFPSIAYQDKALDIKFDTSYLVLESQGKVLIAAFAVFFAKEKYIWLQLIVSIVVSLFLFFICLRMRPCLIRSYNLWKTGGFLVPVWVCSCALINYYTQMFVLALVLLVAGLVTLLAGLVIIYWRVYGFAVRKVKESRKEVGEVKVVDWELAEQKAHNVSAVPGVEDVGVNSSSKVE